MFSNVYSGKKVLVTGHTGFKGSWLCVWLNMLGAEICGISLPMPKPSHYNLLNIDCRSEMCDIRDGEKLKEIFASFQPDIVFHMAAQPIVRLSYEQPVETFAANVMGTVNVLEACRQTSSVKAVVAISSDKCYENREQIWSYRENDAMGGYDPYSASKGCSELVISSYRRSFFNPVDYHVKHDLLLASGRAGNVIGGGDWARDRLVPDIMRAAAANQPVIIRNPAATRPWQHVLEPLSGYLLLGERLFKQDTAAAEGWNFGPDDGVINVGEAARSLSRYWDAIKLDINPPEDQVHEATLLQLDCSKAHYYLNWYGVLSPQETFEMTTRWYKEYYTNGKVITEEQVKEYIARAEERDLSWIK